MVWDPPHLILTTCRGGFRFSANSPVGERGLRLQTVPPQAHARRRGRSSPVSRLPLAVRPSCSAIGRPSTGCRPCRSRQCRRTPSAWQSRRRWPFSPGPVGLGRVPAARKPPATACASLRAQPSINGLLPRSGAPPIIPRPRRCVPWRCHVRSRRLATGPLRLPARRPGSFSLARPFNWV